MTRVSANLSCFRCTPHYPRARGSRRHGGCRCIPRVDGVLSGRGAGGDAGRHDTANPPAPPLLSMSGRGGVA